MLLKGFANALPLIRAFNVELWTPNTVVMWITAAYRTIRFWITLVLPGVGTCVRVGSRKAEGVSTYLITATANPRLTREPTPPQSAVVNWILTQALHCQCLESLWNEVTDRAWRDRDVF